MTDASRSEQQVDNWDIALEYDIDINSYVDQCPLHLFDTQLNRNISRSELKDNICAALRDWMELPITCSEITKPLFETLNCWIIPDRLTGGEMGLRSYVLAAMAKSPLIGYESRFLWAIRNELAADVWVPRLEYWDDRIFPPLCSLIEHKRMQMSRPSHQQVQEQIATIGQYAILSHCWDQDNSQELHFDDVANLSDTRVRAKSGFRKLQGFAQAVKSHYGCRYLWMDTACIREMDRNKSIPCMFGWYRRAYVCIVYLSSWHIQGDRWSTRGWTLQEMLAANRISCFTRTWDPAKEFTAAISMAGKFHACREPFSISSMFRSLNDGWEFIRWGGYEPQVNQAVYILNGMKKRSTTIPEDMVYSLLPALNLNIPIKYGEGLERALYRFQVELLTQGQNRWLLLWKGDISLPHNSMLFGQFSVSRPEEFTCSRVGRHSTEFDPMISFSSDGIMKIMVFLYKPCLSPQPDVFALMGENITESLYCGVLLKKLPGGEYQRSEYKEYRYNEMTIDFDKAPEWIYIK